jgi:hypothetical protein
MSMNWIVLLNIQGMCWFEEGMQHRAGGAMWNAAVGVVGRVAPGVWSGRMMQGCFIPLIILWVTENGVPG